MASFVYNLNTVEKCDQALKTFKDNLDLGLITEKDYASKVEQVEKRKVSLQAKPEGNAVPEGFQEIEVEYLPPRGSNPRRTFKAVLKEGRNGKFLSVVLAAAVKYGSAYVDPSFLDFYIARLLDLRDALNKAGIKTDRKPTA